MYVDKLPQEANPYMERGKGLHGYIEAYLKGSSELSKEIKSNRDFIMQLRCKPGLLVEQDLSFKKDWTRTTYDDWAGCWLRTRIDAMFQEEERIVLIDWKSGKKGSYDEQMELYGLAALIAFPKVEIADGFLVYLDNKNISERVRVVRSEVPALKVKWEKHANWMLSDTEFVRSYVCSWCPFIDHCRADEGERYSE